MSTAKAAEINRNEIATLLERNSRVVSCDLEFPQPIRSDIRPQNFRQRHAAIRLLERLQNRRKEPWRREAGAIERMHKLRLLALNSPKADVCPARLKVGEVGAARNLEVLGDARGP